MFLRSAFLIRPDPDKDPPEENIRVSLRKDQILNIFISNKLKILLYLPRVFLTFFLPKACGHAFRRILTVFSHFMT